MKVYQLSLHKQETKVEGPMVTTPKHAASFILSRMDDENSLSTDWREHTWMLTLNRNNQITGYMELSVGTDTSCQISKKAVCKVAIESFASGVIIAHNHPFGNCTPGQADIKTTADMRRALQILDIALIDHIIFDAEGGFYSFAEERTYNL